MAALDRLSQRFPPGLKYSVNYDTTTFVRATIHDVLITLAEAFGLVVIVVFVFLGSLRATLIPAIAVPVSVIGSFAVLLVLGYSANTVSLLAMVLAIGILVDDAIVVVENVERVMEEEPGLSPAEATKKAMAEITAPIVAITLVLLSVFVPVAFIPGISGELFRQFAVTISVAMLISALNALTLSPALCAVFLRHRGPRRGPMGWVLRRIDNVRNGYAAVVRRLVRVSVLGLVAIVAAGAAIYVAACARRPASCRRRIRARSSSRCSCPTAPRSAAPARPPAASRNCCGRCRRSRTCLPLSDSRFSTVSASPILPFRRHAETVRGPPRRGQLSAGADCPGFRRRPAGPHRNRDPVQPAADHRSVDLGGFEYELEGLEGQDPAAMGSVMQGLVAAANQDPRLSRVFSTYTATNPSIYLDIDREKAQALGLR